MTDPSRIKGEKRSCNALSGKKWATSCFIVRPFGALIQISAEHSSQLIMETEPENKDRPDCSKELSESPSPGQTDDPADSSTESSTEEKQDPVSDQKYPSYDILLKTAEKILKSFEER
jgi:hypothetical protein